VDWGAAILQVSAKDAKNAKVSKSGVVRGRHDPVLSSRSARPSRPSRYKAMTLIEVLAAVTLVALATAALTVGLGAADANVRLRAVSADLIDLDARARLLSRTDGACEVRFPVGGGQREAVLALVGQEEPFSAVELPRGARVEARALEGDPLKVVRFGRDGRTIDYRVTVTMDELTAAWTVAGLTGWVEPEEVPP